MKTNVVQLLSACDGPSAVEQHQFLCTFCLIEQNIDHSKSSDILQPSSLLGAKAHVIDDKMFLLKTGNMTRNVIHALDLNSLSWEVLVPGNTLSVVSDGFTSWVHLHRIYVFGGGCSNQDCIGMGGACGGASNLLYCYNRDVDRW